MKIAALVFDSEDVLYDATVWRRWLLQLLSRLGMHTNYRTFYHVWEREFLHDVNRGRREYWEALKAFIKSAGLSPGQIDEVLAAGHARFRQLREKAFPLPGVASTLHKLAALNVPMGVVANVPCTAENLNAKLGKLGFLVSFQAVVTSFDVDANMPEATPYESILAKLKLSASEVAFVSHDQPELTGAAKIGMPTIAFNYEPKTNADVYLERFEQLLSNVHFQTPQLLAG